MKFFFIFIFSLLSSSVCLEQPSKSILNLCTNCKYFIPFSQKHITTETSNKYGKCALFPTIKYKEVYFLPNHTKRNLLVKDYRDCDTARKYEFMCGKNGNRFLVGGHTSPLRSANPYLREGDPLLVNGECIFGS